MSTAATLPALNSSLTPYAKETKYEFLRLLRAKSFAFSTIGFPVCFYLLFGVLAAGSGAEQAERAAYLLATYSVFGLVGSSLFGLCSTIANERAQGWLELKQASPMPRMAYLLAKLLTAMAFALIIFGVLLLCGTTMAHVHFTAAQFTRLILTVILGVFPFASMGILLATIVPPNAAIGFVNLIYLPMSFLSGLWFPLKGLPSWIQKIAPIWPTWHLGQLALHDIGVPMTWSVGAHVLWLAAFSAVCLAIAAHRFRASAMKA
jgi:ABC-2 type transport system permease protein